MINRIDRKLDYHIQCQKTLEDPKASTFAKIFAKAAQSLNLLTGGAPLLGRIQENATQNAIESLRKNPTGENLLQAFRICEEHGYPNPDWIYPLLLNEPSKAKTFLTTLSGNQSTSTTYRGQFIEKFKAFIQQNKGDAQALTTIQNCLREQNKSKLSDPTISYLIGISGPKDPTILTKIQKIEEILQSLTNAS